LEYDGLKATKLCKTVYSLRLFPVVVVVGGGGGGGGVPTQGSNI